MMGGFFEFNPTLEVDFTKNPSCILGVPLTLPPQVAGGGLARPVSTPAR